MKKLPIVVFLFNLVIQSGFLLFASGTSSPPPVSGTGGYGGSQGFQYESAKARVVSVDKEKGILVLREEKKKDPKEITLTVNSKTRIKAGKENIELSRLQVGSLVKVVFDHAFNAVSIKLEKEKEQKV